MGETSETGRDRRSGEGRKGVRSEGGPATDILVMLVSRDNSIRGVGLNRGLKNNGVDRSSSRANLIGVFFWTKTNGVVRSDWGVDSPR